MLSVRPDDPLTLSVQVPHSWNFNIMSSFNVIPYGGVVDYRDLFDEVCDYGVHVE